MKPDQNWSNMTVRDYIAMEAMKAIISNTEYLKSLAKEKTYHGIRVGQAVSHQAYSYADDLIAQSIKK